MIFYVNCDCDRCHTFIMFYITITYDITLYSLFKSIIKKNKSEN